MTYSFPNISVNESLVGPIPFPANWRNTIGVAGQFRKGPKGPYLVTSRQDFSIFGEDNSPGALFVKQAMYQGATNFIISRAIQTATNATNSLVLASTLPNAEARIGYEGNTQQFSGSNPVYTTGLTFTAGYISSAAYLNTVGGEVKVKPQSKINHKLLFQDLGVIDYCVEEFIESDLKVVTTNTTTINVPNPATDPVNIPVQPIPKAIPSGSLVYFEGAVLTLTTNANQDATQLTGIISAAIVPSQTGVVSLNLISSTDVKLVATQLIPGDHPAEVEQVQIMLFDKTHQNFRANLKPGRRLFSNTTDITFDSDPTSASNSYLQVISYSWEYDANQYACLVKGKVVVNTPATSYSVKLAEVPENGYVVSHLLRSNVAIAYAKEATDTNSYVFLERKFTIDRRNAVVDSFEFVPQVAYNTYRKHNFYFQIDGGQNVLVLNSGVEVRYEEYASCGKVAYLEGAMFRIGFARGSVTIGGPSAPFSIGETASQILRRLKTAIENNVVLTNLFRRVELSTTVLPYHLKLTTVQEGEEANNVYWFLTRTVLNGTANDLIFNADNATASNTNFTTPSIFFQIGAVNGATNASRTLYTESGYALVRVEALSVGKHGNKIKISVNPGPAGTFTLYVEDEDAKSYAGRSVIEVFNLNNRETNVNTGLYNATLNSRLIRAFYIPYERGFANDITEQELDIVPMRLAPPFGRIIPTLNSGSPLPIAAEGYKGQPYLTNIYLQGGDDNQEYRPFVNTVSDAVMEEAVNALESENIAILSIAGVHIKDPKYAKSVAAMIRQINTCNTYNGLRIGVLSAPPRLAASQAEEISSIYQSERLVILAGHITMAGEPRSNINIPATGAYAGYLAINQPQYSPAAIVSTQGVVGVMNTDVPNDPTYLDRITKARLDALIFDRGLSVYKFLNGINTSVDPNKKYVCIRRLLDQIISDLTYNLSWVRSRPNDSDLQKRVATSCDAYLTSLVRKGALYRHAPTVCNRSNNTVSEMSQGILNVRITITPVYPADFIRIALINDITENFNLTI